MSVRVKASGNIVLSGNEGSEITKKNDDATADVEGASGGLLDQCVQRRPSPQSPGPPRACRSGGCPLAPRRRYGGPPSGGASGLEDPLAVLKRGCA